MSCTCPLCDTGPIIKRDKDCKDHGLETLVVPDNLTVFRYPGGITVLAGSQESADEMHGRMAANRNRPRA